MKKLSIIGAGRIAEAHIAAFFLLDRSDIAISGILGRSRSRAQALADKYKIRLYDSVDQLRTDNVDAVLIAVNENSVFSVLNSIGNINCRIYIEKPLGYKASLIPKLKTISNQTQRRLKVLFNRRFYRGVQEFRRQMKETPSFTYAQIASTRRQFVEYGYDTDVIDNIEYSYHVHMIDLLNYIFGDIPQEIIKVESTNCCLLVKLSYGPHLVFLNSLYETKARWILEHSQPDLFATFQGMEKSQFALTNSSFLSYNETSDGIKPGFKCQMDSICNEIVSGIDSDIPNFDYNLKLMNLINEIYEK